MGSFDNDRSHDFIPSKPIPTVSDLEVEKRVVEIMRDSTISTWNFHHSRHGNLYCIDYRHIRQDIKLWHSSFQVGGFNGRFIAVQTPEYTEQFDRLVKEHNADRERRSIEIRNRKNYDALRHLS